MQESRVKPFASNRQTSRRELLDQVLDEDLPRYAEALKRLGE